MASDLQNLLTQRSNLIAALTASSVNPQPSYNIGGQSVSWNEFRAGINSQLQEINGLIAAAEGPWEIRSRGRA
jgi:hypothetical protein